MVVEFERGVYCGSVTELGVLVGGWMREGPRVTCAAPGDVSLVSAVDAAGVRPDDGASSDCRAARASAAGTVDAFGAHDGVRFGNERDAQESRQD
jgi:hypothetical protein